MNMIKKTLMTVWLAVAFSAVSISQGDPYTIMVTPANPCAGDNVSFEFIDQGNSDSILWVIDGGEQHIGSVLTGPHVFSRGQHLIAATVYYKNLDSIVTHQLYFHVNGGPGSFSPANNSEFCPGEDIKLRIAPSEDGSPLEWYIDNVYVSGDAEYVFQPENNRYYDIKLIEYSPQCGIDSAIHTIEIKEGAKTALAPYTLSEGPFCPYDKIYFGYDGNLDPSSISWNFGDGASNSSLQNPGHVFQSPGLDTVRLYGTNNCGGIPGQKTIVIRIDTNAPANADFMTVPEYMEVCPYTPIRFYAKGTGQYQWDFGDGGFSDKALPVYLYGKENSYDVKLKVTNGCENSATETKEGYVQVLYSEPYQNSNTITAYFDMPMVNPERDTFEICVSPQLVKLGVQLTNEEDLEYQWIITNLSLLSSDTLYNKTILYQFQPYNYLIHLYTKNNCNAYTNDTLYVVSNPSLYPVNDFRVFPYRLCPGEIAYFWDNAIVELNSTVLPYDYSIDYGDGQTESPVTNYENYDDRIIRSHPYSGTHTFTFSATNDCGNTSDMSGEILVADNVPSEYMIHNSSRSWEEDQQPVKIMQDWSTYNVNDKVIKIASELLINPGENEDYYYLIYEGGLSGIPDRMPDGYVKRTVLTGTTVYDSAELYIPSYINDIGVVVGWYCHKEDELMHLPDISLIHTGADTLYHIILDRDTINLRDTTYLMLFSDCTPRENPEDIYGLWRYDGGTHYIFTDFFKDEDGTDYYDIYHSINPTGFEKEFISRGTFTKDQINISLYGGINDPCYSMQSDFDYSILGDILYLSSTEKGCFYRDDSIDNKYFTRIPRPHPVQTACSGDTVKFSIYGGYSYIWNFGDGSPQSTAQSPYHVYITTGTYNVYCLVTNYCGTTDTVYSPVVVSPGVKPIVDFGTDNWYVKEDQEIKFRYKNHYEDDRANDYDFHWEFGDGKTSTAINPIHTYTNPGLYNVTLGVSNNCGTIVSPPKEITVGKACDVYPRFRIEVDTSKPNELNFINTSIGNIRAIKFWKFDDEAYKLRISDTLTRILADGPHTTCLLITESNNDCNDVVCKEYLVGTVNCQADFEYSVNSETYQVYFTNTSINTTNYYWEFGDGTYSTLENPVKKYKKPGYYLVILTATNATCTSIKEEWILVGDDATSCVADFWYTSDATDSTIIQFQNNSITQGQITSGYYEFGDGRYSFNDLNPSHKYNEPGIYKVCAGFIDNNGCQARVCKPVNVGNLDCNADFHVIHSRTNTSAIFIADSIEGAQYFWDFGDGSATEGRIISHFFRESGYYSVCLNVVNANTNCFVEMCKEIQIIGDTGTTLCQVNISYLIDQTDRTVNFSARSVTPFTNWLWEFGDGTVSYAHDTSYRYIEDGVYPVCLYAYDEVSGCFDDECKRVVITGLNTGEQLIADFSAINIPGSLKVKYKNRSQGEITNKYWTFGDGTFDLGLGGDTVSHIFPDDGLWNSCLIVLNSSTYNANKKCKRIFVGDTNQCNLNADFSKIVIPEDLKVNFFDRSTGGAYRWFWNFGDGNSSNGRKPSHNYRTPGLYLVTLSVQDITGNCIDHTAQFVQVGQADCRARFEFSVSVASNTVRFKNTSMGNISSYLWDFGDGGISTDPDPLHIFSPGKYSVSLTVSNDAGCVDHYYEQIQVGIVPCDAAFTVYVDTNNKAYFNNKTLGGINKLLWIFGDGAISERNDPIHQYKFPGIYTIGLYAYTGTCMDYYEETVIVGAREGDMQAFFVQTVDESTLTVNFFDRSIGIDENTTYIWDFGDTTTSDMQNPVKTYAEGGYYFVCLTVIGQDGMQNTTCKMVRVAPPASRSCLSDFFYTVDSATLTGTFTSTSYGVTPATIYQWIVGKDVVSEGGSEVTHIFDTAGFYNVGLRIRNSVTGCTSVEYKLVNVGKGDQGIKASFAYEIDSSSLKAGGYPVDLVGTASPPKPAKFSWDFGDKKKASGLSTTSRVTHIYALSGSYIPCFMVEDPQTHEMDEYCQVISVGSTKVSNLNSSLLIFDNNPNPFSDYTHITYAVSEKMYIELVVLDNLGREISTLIKTNKDAGTHEYLWDTSELTEGVYYLRLTTSKGWTRTRMVVKK